MKMRTVIVGAVMALSATAAAASAQAAELVTNGGFETGSFSGWDLSGNAGNTGVTTSAAISGTYGALLGPVGSDGILTQSITTVPGSHYTFSFDLLNEGGTPNGFIASFNNNVLLSIINTAAFGPAHYSYDVVAGGPSSQIKFSYFQNPAYFHLDNVSLQGTGGAVPEPATWATMILGLGMVGALMRRRRLAAVA